MDKKKKIVPANVLAVSLVDKMRQRVADIERMRLGQLTRPLVREWQRLKLLEKEVFGN